MNLIRRHEVTLRPLPGRALQTSDGSYRVRDVKTKTDSPSSSPQGPRQMGGSRVARHSTSDVEYLTAVAQAEGLDLQAERRNPTGLGIHNEMVQAQISGKGWVIAGSLDGGDVSAKLNREMAPLVGSDEAYVCLAGVFWYDWEVTP
jgi:hypothetical protein